MKYGSVCSGIEAATQAWHTLGWQPAFFSEIEAFPSSVLAHHYPSIPNLGDMTKFEEWPEHAIDLLVGGTPCQSFSVAGLRHGLNDPRGNLMLTYLAIARRYQPRWLVWENVPGVLSSNGGRDFGTFIRGLEECGYHAAWRVLDAQYCRVDGFAQAVPQRRRRVFVVGYLGDWRRAAAVLFEREGMRWDSAPRRQEGQGTAGRNLLGALDGEFNPTGNVSGPITTGAAHTNRSSVVAFDTTQITSKANYSQPKAGDPCHPLASGAHPPAIAFGAQNSASQGDGVSFGYAPTLDKSKVPAVAFDMRGREGGSMLEGPHDTANIRAANGGSSRSYVAEPWAVRRLTPRECERLQGFPDDFTAVPYRGKPAADAPRYKALGNSMASNVMRWIGQRIALVEEIGKENAA